MSRHTVKFAYFGGEPIGVPVLEELKNRGFLPGLVVCNPDRPVGRKQILTPPPVKVWAQANHIEVYQPEKIPKNRGDLERLTNESWDLFIVVAFNMILPKWFLDIPNNQTLNVHPSLLPLLRGASPIRSSILNDMREECGVSIMTLDEKMDHGPLVAQEKLNISKDVWPMSGPELDEALARLGGFVLANVIPDWLEGNISTQEQNHEAATYCTKITKDMAELDINPENLPSGTRAYAAFLKIQAYTGWPTAFFVHNTKRYKITGAHMKDNKLIIDKIIPEGKAETDFIKVFGQPA